MRNLVPILLILILLGLFGGFAYLTQHPETPWLEEAEGWPLVGDLASRFRTAYLGRAARESEPDPAESKTPGSDEGAPTPAATRPRRAPPTPPTAVEPPARQPTAPETAELETPSRNATAETGEDLPTAEQVESMLAALGRTLTTGRRPPAARPNAARPNAARPTVDRPALDLDLPYQVDEWIWCLPGNRILADSEAGSGVLARLSSMAYLPVLGRRGEWARVAFRGEQGWIDTSWQPPFKRRKAGRGILRHRYEPVRASDSQRLKRARKILGIDRPSRKLGDYDLYTDVEDEDLLAFLDLAAATAEEAYFARFGRRPSGDPKRSAVLFAQRADYRRYSEDAPGLPGTEAGHAGRGVLAMFAEGGSRQSLARTLVHEIGHLLNNRAVALRLPIWLEEGMASDLGSLWVEGSPDDDGPLAGFLSLVTNSPEARMLALANALEAGELPSVSVLMSLDRKTFQLNPAYAYTHGAALVRFLLDSEDGRHGEAFRTFLKRVAAGHGADPAMLLRLLEMDAAELDEKFRAWLRAEAAAAGERLEVEIAAAPT